MGHRSKTFGKCFRKGRSCRHHQTYTWPSHVLCPLVVLPAQRHSHDARCPNNPPPQPDGAVEAASAAALRAIATYNPHAGAAGEKAAGHSDKGTAAPAKGGAGASPGAGADAAPDLGPLRAATEALAALKGVGPATASALLAAACPHAPFMSDEAAAAALPAARKSDYSLKVWVDLGGARWALRV